MNSQSKEFVELQEQWYKKLKDSGFNDIEQDENYLLTSAYNMFNPNRNKVGSIQGVVDRMNSKAEYYRLAGHFLHEFKFPTELEKEIWDLHSQGISHRNIILKLKQKGVKLGKFDIWLKLSNLKKW
jgi:hypothetical protein